MSDRSRSGGVVAPADVVVVVVVVVVVEVVVCLFDLILYVPSTIFQLNRSGSSWVEPVLS